MICTKSVSGPTFKTDLIPLQRKDSIFEPHQRQDSTCILKVDSSHFEITWTLESLRSEQPGQS